MKSWIVALALVSAGCGHWKKKYNELEPKYAAEMARATQLEQELNASSDRAAALAGKAAELEASVEEMERGIAELRARQAEADKEVQAYKDLLAKFKELIDAGTLRVKIV